MQINDTDYILGVWFIEHDKSNVMSILKRDTDENNWVGELRFRHFVDNKVFDSEDKKTVYEITVKNKTENEVIEMQAKWMNEASGLSLMPLVDHFIVKGDSKKFMEMALTKEWMHMTSSHVTPSETVQ